MAYIDPYPPPNTYSMFDIEGKVKVVEYDPDWPNQFQTIKAELIEILSEGEVKWKSIEHVGSTSIPGLAAKPNIDIVIVVADNEELQKAIEAFNWQRKVPRYTRYPRGGGILGRESFKLYDVLPRRSVFVVDESDPLGQIGLKNYHDIRKILLENKDLKQEYAELKLRLSMETFKYPLVEYGRKKTDIIHKMLTLAGWTTSELEALAKLDIRTPEADLGEDYMF